MLARHLDLLAATPEWPPLAAGHPALLAWLARMTGRPSFAAIPWGAHGRGRRLSPTR
jgi:glutathione S-transferase